MLKRLKKFSEREDGAISIDWVVLTAAMVAFGTFIGLYIGDNVRELDTANGAVVSRIEVQEIGLDFSGNVNP